MKQVCGLKGRTYEEKLHELGLLSLEERRHQTDMCQVYKILHGKDKAALKMEMMANNIRSTRATAEPLNICIPRARLDIRKHFFTNRVVDSWNKIPRKIKEARTVESFKHQYMVHRESVLAAAQDRRQ